LNFVILFNAGQRCEAPTPSCLSRPVSGYCAVIVGLG
jgi:hypothetical protein